MILDLGDEAKEYGREATRAIASAGGDELVQQAEAKPDTREALVAPLLAGLGAWELDARTDPDSLEAAAALCRSAGYWALPYPLAERLARPTDFDADELVVITTTTPQGVVAGLDKRWATVTLDGERSMVAGQVATGPAFSAALKLSLIDSNGVGDVRTRSNAAVLDIARNARPCNGTHYHPCSATQAVRPAAISV